jgi:uncharacterized protein (TIGR02246 family)
MRYRRRAGRRLAPEVNKPDVAGELAASFARTWNQHDMDALAELFHEDAAFVNVRGGYLTSREEIRAQHAAIHAGPYKDSVLRVEVTDTRELAPGIIMAHVRTELDGDDRAPGQTQRSVATFVIERRAELWRFIAAHNTLVTPAAG